jgi:PPOX class probable FMN-dependent enzyme
MDFVANIAELEKHYGQPKPPALAKEIDYVHEIYQPFIEKAPFVALATVSDEGIDCSPRGDFPGFVRIADPKTLMMPDRKGNDRIDSLRNIVKDPRCSFMFMIPGSNTVLRVNGRAKISVNEELRRSFEVEKSAPRSVIVLSVDKIYFQCARALMRSEFWSQEAQIDPKSLPTPGTILSVLSDAKVGGEPYDKAWPERAKNSMW